MWWTLAASSVASITALLIAFVAYPWQKRKERESEIMQERRIAYVEYASAAKALVFAQPFAGSADVNTEYLSIGEKEQRFYAAKDAVFMLAPQRVANKMLDHEAALRNYVILHSKVLQGEPVEKQPREYAPEEKRLFEEVIRAFRADIQSHAEGLGLG